MCSFRIQIFYVGDIVRFCFYLYKSLIYYLSIYLNDQKKKVLQAVNLLYPFMQTKSRTAFFSKYTSHHRACSKCIYRDVHPHQFRKNCTLTTYQWVVLGVLSTTSSVYFAKHIGLSKSVICWSKSKFAIYWNKSYNRIELIYFGCMFNHFLFPVAYNVNHL